MFVCLFSDGQTLWCETCQDIQKDTELVAMLTREPPESALSPSCAAGDIPEAGLARVDVSPPPHRSPPVHSPGDSTTPPAVESQVIKTESLPDRRADSRGSDDAGHTTRHGSPQASVPQNDDNDTADHYRTAKTETGDHPTPISLPAAAFSPDKPAYRKCEHFIYFL